MEKVLDIVQINAPPRIVAIIPAYNEDRFIGSVVLKTRCFADVVVVIDDGSNDATAEIAQVAGAIVVRHTQNQGKGAALNTGFKEARKHHPDVVVTLDADGQHLPEEISQVVEPVLEGRADIVVGSRYLDDKSEVPLHRILGHHVFNFVTNQMSGVSLTDSQSGFRAFSPRAARAFGFSSNGFSVESEMQFLAREHDLAVVEAPITIRYHDKPKRPVIAHGLMVLNGILSLVGQHRPFLFFGLPSTIALVFGLLWGAWVVQIYQRTQMLDVGYALFSMLLFIIGSLGLFAGVTLHSVRGLLINLIRSRERG